MLYSSGLLAALTGLTLASPVEKASTPKTFSVQQVAVPHKDVPANVVLQAYKKYNAVPFVPPVVLAAAVPSNNVAGSAAAYPASVFNEKYYCPVSIGSQSFNLTFDTGSADTWLLSTLMPTDQSYGHKLYNPSKTGKKMAGQSWGITYGDSSGAQGVVYADKVVIAGATATSQAIEAATSASASFLSDYIGSGLIGAAFKPLNTVRPTQQNTFFDNVKANLAKKLFAVTLRKDSSGSYDFGYINASRYTGAITYMNVDYTTGFWQVPYGAYKIGSTGKVVELNFKKIFDTGTSLLLLPQQIVTQYYAKVSGAGYSSQYGGYTFPCTQKGFSLPDIGVRVGGTMFNVPGAYINWAQINGTHCFGGLQLSTGLPFSILGDVFLKAVYAVFDQTQKVPRIGLAKQANLSGLK